MALIEIAFAAVVVAIERRRRRFRPEPRGSRPTS
jgi:hypothetical protein